MNLNDTVWAKLAPSRIHGIGVVAIRDIPAGQKIYCQSTRQEARKDFSYDILPEIRHLIIQRWPRATEGGEFLSPNDDARLLSFMNHSGHPNYDPYTDTTLQDIKRGEEITEDYMEYKNICLNQ
jgi:hypothetical protein